jgi:hypothetical protein
MVNDAVKQIVKLRSSILQHFDELICDGKYIQFRNEYITADFPEWFEMEDELIDIILNYELPTSSNFYYDNFLELIFLDKNVTKENVYTYCNDVAILNTFMCNKYFDEIVINDISIIHLLRNRFKTSEKLSLYIERNYNFHELVTSTTNKKEYLIVRKPKDV